MNVLIACEESQTITKEMRLLGHNAFSCDIQSCGGGKQDWHYKGDVRNILNGCTDFVTEDGTHHEIESAWDLVIAHPPCTFLTITGNRWFLPMYGLESKSRYRDRIDAIQFFMLFALECNAKRIAIENPVGIMSSVYRKPDQIIQPYEFGEATTKRTCLWLKDLPLLTATDIVKPQQYVYKSNGKTDPEWHMMSIGLPTEERRKMRSRTFKGIAQAMAMQWAGDNRNTECKTNDRI